MSKLLLIDGLNITRRCWEANPAADSVEKAEAAVSAATRSMIRGLREHQPTHCLAIFDAGGPTWRHALYPDYKVHRKPMSDYLLDELVLMKERMAHAGWALMALSGEEADDTLHGVSAAARMEGEDVVALSTDKDIVRLVELGVQVYNHFDRRWHDAAWCLARFGVPPAMLTDFLALMGDTVDNIPGVDKVGVKTAAKLLLEYGALPAILAAAEAGDIKGKVGERLAEQKERALLSYELATLRSAFNPLDLWWDELEAPKYA